MKSLITGGAGFIGSHLAEYLLEQGNEVFVVDNLSTGSMDNILHLKNHSGFHYVIDTILNAELLAELVDLSDVIFHFAAAVGVRLVVDEPTRTIETNVNGTEIVLQLASKKGKLVVLASTSEVYGKSNTVPFKEDDDLILGPTTKARWCYACSKALDEFLAFAHHRERGLPIIIVRLFNTVGPRQTGRYGMVIPRFVGQALKGEPITVYGTGEQSRCFIYVGDIVKALVELAKCPQAIGEVFNVGSNEEVKVIELANMVKRATESDSEIVFIPYHEAYAEGFEDVMRRVPDISKIRNLIGFEPKVALTEILSRVINQRSELKLRVS